MKRLLAILLLLPFIASGQTPFKGTDYMFYYQMNVGKTNGTLTTPSAWLEIGKDSTTKGMRIPRIVDTVNISSPVYGLLIYQISDNGIYFRDKFGWRKLAAGDIAGTVNILSKFGGTGQNLVNSQIFDNGTNVGINNVSPAAKLDVGGAFHASGTGDVNTIMSVTGNSTGIANGAAIQFRKSNLSRVGYVGDAASFNDQMYITVLNGSNLRFAGINGDGVGLPISMNALFTNSGKFVFGDSLVTGTATFRIKGSEQVDSLAIGTATPTERLQINGNIIANAPNYVSGGISSVGRNNTTGRFEVFTSTPVVGPVTSVGLALPSIFTVTNSPVTSSGTLTGAFNNQLANLMFASPNGASGQPLFRSLTNTDLPASGVVAGSYGSDTTSATVTVNSKGVLTSAASIPIAVPWDSVRRKPFVTFPTLAQVTGTGNVTNSPVSIGKLTAPIRVMDIAGDIQAVTPTGGAAYYISTSTNIPRWAIGVINTEGILNAGADFRILRYDSVGGTIGTLLTATRSTGNVGIGTATTTEKLNIAGNIVATAPTYTSGGITTLGRNTTTGRFETFAPAVSGPVTLKTHNTDATGADTIYTYTIPPAYMANSGDVVKTTYAGFFAATGATAHIVGMGVGGTVVASMSNGTTSGGSWEIETTIVRVNNTTVRTTTRIVFDNTGVTASLYLHTTAEVTGLDLSANGLRIGLPVGSPNVNVTAQLGAVIYYPGAP